MKRFVTLTALFALTMVLVSGCSSGISKASYDAALKESSDLKGQLSTVEANLTAAKADLTTAQQSLTTVTADRDSAKNQLDKAKADLTNAQQSFSTLNTSVKTYQSYVDVTAIWLDAWSNVGIWDGAAWAAWDVRFDAAVANSQDSDLKTLNNTMETKTGAEHVAAENAVTKLLLQKLADMKPTTK